MDSIIRPVTVPVSMEAVQLSDPSDAAMFWLSNTGSHSVINHSGETPYLHDPQSMMGERNRPHLLKNSPSYLFRSISTATPSGPWLSNRMVSGHFGTSDSLSNPLAMTGVDSAPQPSTHDLACLSTSNCITPPPSCLYSSSQAETEPLSASPYLSPQSMMEVKSDQFPLANNSGSIFFPMVLVPTSDSFLTCQSVQSQGENLSTNEKKPTCLPAEPVTRKVKRIRTVFTQDQLRELNKEFCNNQFPDKSIKLQLTENLGLKEKVVSQWFKNQRVKLRKKMNNRAGQQVGMSNSIGHSVNLTNRGVSGFQPVASISTRDFSDVHAWQQLSRLASTNHPPSAASTHKEAPSCEFC